METYDTEAIRATIKANALGVLARWHTLIAEYKTYYQAVCKFTQRGEWPGVTPVINALSAESAEVTRLIERLDDPSNDNDLCLQRIDASGKHAASTLVAKEAMWSTIKKCRGLKALERRVSTTHASKSKFTHPNKLGDSRAPDDSAFIHAVVDDGREWLRVLNMTEKRLLHEMAEAGWDFLSEQARDDREFPGSSDVCSESGEDGEDDEDDEDGIAGISIMEAAAALVQAARANRRKGVCPRVSLVLGRINENKTPDIDMLLRRIRRRLAEMNRSADAEDEVCITIYCANSEFNQAEPPPLDVAISRLLPDMVVASKLTPTVNIDTSMLVAIASDITHKVIGVQPWHSNQVAYEIRRESSRPGEVAHEIFEALRDKQMVCTQEAASAFSTMLATMGQDSEKARARALLGDASIADATRSDLVQQLRDLSEYGDAIPDDLRLPVKVIDEEWDKSRIDRAVDTCELPAVAHFVAEEMDEQTPTRAVFFYGWASGHVTVTMNHTARNRIKKLIERFRTNKCERAPLVWVYYKGRRGLNATPKPSSKRQSEGGHSGSDAGVDNSS